MKSNVCICLFVLAGVISLTTMNNLIAVKDTGDAVNFSEHIAPIIFNNCTTCHRPGEAAPFTLMNYSDVKKRGKLIASVTRSNIMPPWKAGKGDYRFKNERGLTDGQIELIQRWVAEGMPEGDSNKLPAMPKFPEGWRLGQPDLVVKMSEAYSVPADGPDIYRNFVIPLNLNEDRWISAIEFRPGARSVVHHSLFFYDTTGAARKFDEADSEPGYRGGMAGLSQGLFIRPGNSQPGGNIAPGILPSTVGGLGGWAVGAQGRVLPEGLAWYIPKGSDLILSTHFHPSGKAEKEISTVGLYFADKPPVKKFAGVQLPPLFGVFEGLDIPAGAKEYTIEDSFELPVDVKAFGASAHAHYLAREMKMTATLPTGQTKTLLWIKDWDFSWQEQYQFKDYVSLPKGTLLSVKIIYDNSAGNPRNPSSPPKRVKWGEGSTDEMGSMSLAVVAANETELPQLQRATRQHLSEAFLNSPALSKFRRRDN